MGLLVDGQWKDQWYDTESTGGKFKRQEQAYRHWITADGEPGPSGEGGFQAEPDRYHLYVSLACPWAHRALIVRALKGLEEMLPISVVHWYMAEHGWTFEPGPGVIPDPIHNVERLYQLYQKADPGFTGRVTVPVLWDKQRDTIVNNESSEIIRMLNTAFDELGAEAGDYYPEPLREEIDAVNERVYHTLNNGVYKSGFATTQEAYEEAVYPLFETMDWLEERLAGSRWLVGNTLTEADIRLFTTLVRFDPVYHGHFKCNVRRLTEYPNLWGFTRDLYQHPKIRETVNFEHIKKHYYASHETINPTRIVPVGPELEFEARHGREGM
ncbi:glutathione S-transferase family protein [Lentisalinibacter orientalis]|uniref:glutathione S-transferase family protein n=1 Tax=Lentisalinibacter orientalis TaxID=2992241 RepID=UPI00386F545E